jgi:mismatch-specific thymine-DNA glycosylase
VVPRVSRRSRISTVPLVAREIGKSIAHPVPDVISPDLDVLFVGINPDPVSGACGHHFANPRNGFWRLPHEAGFTGTQLDRSDEARLVEEGIGVTNLVSRITRSSSELTRDDFERARLALRRKVERWRPRAIIFVGLTAWRATLGKHACIQRWQTVAKEIGFAPTPRARRVHVGE